jgi:hypothetical protein
MYDKFLETVAKLEADRMAAIEKAQGKFESAKQVAFEEYSKAVEAETLKQIEEGLAFKPEEAIVPEVAVAKKAAAKAKVAANAKVK